MRAVPGELAAGRQRYTYEDYCRLPEGSPYQLIGGELVTTPSPTPYHQMVSMKLELKMAGYVLEKGLGIVLDAPVDVYLEETETYQPDIIYISNERLSIIEEKRINGAPDLVVEILSPGTGYYDLRTKYKVYEKSGVREYWIVDPHSKSVQVFCLKGGKYALDQEVEQQGEVQSRVIAGFAVQTITPPPASPTEYENTRRVYRRATYGRPGNRTGEARMTGRDASTDTS